MPYIPRSVNLSRAGWKDVRTAKPFCSIRSGTLLCAAVVLVTGLQGCGEATLSSSSVSKLLLTVEPGRSPGLYQLSGTTDLPEETELMVQAVRLLTPTGQALPEDGSGKHYVILDRDRVLVSEGSWETELQLWENQGGASAESWQMQLPQSDRSFSPDDQVRFTVSTPPTGDERALESQWERSKQLPSEGTVSFTPDGNWFLQAEESIALAPPVAAVPDQPNSFNARRDLAETESDIPLSEAAVGPAAKAEETTNAPLSDAELLR